MQAKVLIVTVWSHFDVPFREEEKEKGLMTGKVMLPTQQFHTTFLNILLSKCIAYHFYLQSFGAVHKSTALFRRWGKLVGKDGRRREWGKRVANKHETHNVKFYSNAWRRHLEVTAYSWRRVSALDKLCRNQLTLSDTVSCALWQEQPTKAEKKYANTPTATLK